jgi:hypothetical protein
VSAIGSDSPRNADLEVFSPAPKNRAALRSSCFALPAGSRPSIDRRFIAKGTLLMPAPANAPVTLEAVSSKLQQLYALVLKAEREFDPAAAGLALLDRLVNDPAWAWLRPLSLLIAELDHVLAQDSELSVNERAAAAAHIRGLVFGEGDSTDEVFLVRYRPLLQLDHSLASVHGELKQLLNALPAESENESERLHARHQWAMRRKHRRPDHSS